MGTHMNSGKIGQVYDIERVGSALSNKLFPLTVLIKLNSVFLTFWIILFVTVIGSEFLWKDLKFFDISRLLNTWFDEQLPVCQ